MLAKSIHCAASPVSLFNILLTVLIPRSQSASQCTLQVVRQLKRGIFEELEGVQELSSTTHICWKGFKPLVEVAIKPVSFYDAITRACSPGWPAFQRCEWAPHSTLPLNPLHNSHESNIRKLVRRDLPVTHAPKPDCLPCQSCASHCCPALPYSRSHCLCPFSCTIDRQMKIIYHDACVSAVGRDQHDDYLSDHADQIATDPPLQNPARLRTVWKGLCLCKATNGGRTACAAHFQVEALPSFGIVTFSNALIGCSMQ